MEERAETGAAGGVGWVGGQAAFIDGAGGGEVAAGAVEPTEQVA